MKFWHKRTPLRIYQFCVPGVELDLFYFIASHLTPSIIIKECAQVSLVTGSKSAFVPRGPGSEPGFEKTVSASGSRESAGEGAR